MGGAVYVAKEGPAVVIDVPWIYIRFPDGTIWPPPPPPNGDGEPKVKPPRNPGGGLPRDGDGTKDPRGKPDGDPPPGGDKPPWWPHRIQVRLFFDVDPETACYPPDGEPAITTVFASLSIGYTDDHGNWVNLGPLIDDEQWSERLADILQTEGWKLAVWGGIYQEHAQGIVKQARFVYEGGRWWTRVPVSGVVEHPTFDQHRAEFEFAFKEATNQFQIVDANGQITETGRVPIYVKIDYSAFAGYEPDENDPYKHPEGEGSIITFTGILTGIPPEVQATVQFGTGGGGEWEPGTKVDDLSTCVDGLG